MDYNPNEDGNRNVFEAAKLSKMMDSELSDVDIAILSRWDQDTALTKEEIFYLLKLLNLQLIPIVGRVEK